MMAKYCRRTDKPLIFIFNSKVVLSSNPKWRNAALYRDLPQKLSTNGLDEHNVKRRVRLDCALSWVCFQLGRSLRTLSTHVVFHNLSSTEEIVRLFPESFHSSLKNLLAKILLDNRWAPQAPPTDFPDQWPHPSEATSSFSPALGMVMMSCLCLWCVTAARGKRMLSGVRVSL